MKRNFAIEAKDPPAVRPSSMRLGGIARHQSSHMHCDTSRMKRMKFSDPGMNDYSNVQIGISSIRHEITGRQRSEAPKTSEFAFFKKLKTDAGHSRTNPLHKEGNQSKNVGLSDSTGGRSKNLSSSIRVEKETMTDNALFFSPPGYAHKNLAEKGVFSMKRRRLHQWIADVSCPEMHKLCSQGFDLVSVLLSRLFPEENEIYSHADPKPKQLEFDTKYWSLPYVQSDTYAKGDCFAHAKYFMNSEHLLRGDDSIRGWIDRPRKCLCPKWDIAAMQSSVDSATDSQIQYEYSIPYSDLDSKKTASLHVVSHSPLHSYYEKYGSFLMNDPKNQSKSYDQNESSLRRKKPTLLLGWDFKNEEDKQELSIIPQNANVDLYASLVSSRDDDSWQYKDENVGTAAMCSSSLFSNNFSGCTPSPNFNSAAFPIHSFGRDLENENYLILHVEQCPLTLSCVPKYFQLEEDRSIDNVLESSNIINSAQTLPCFINKAFRDNDHSCMETLLSAGLDVSLRPNFSLLSDPLTEHSSTSYESEFSQYEGSCSYLLTDKEKESYLCGSDHTSRFYGDILKCSDRSPINFRASLDKNMDHYLLHDNSRYERKKKRFCNDNDVEEWEYI